MKIIPEELEFLDAIDALHRSVFGPGCHVRASYYVREQGYYDPALSFVALQGNTLVATVRLTWITTSISRSRGLLLGPLAVAELERSKGLGKKLVTKCLEAAKATDADFVMLVGDQPYYGKLGFEIVPQGKVTMPRPVNLKRLLVCPINGFDVSGLEGVVHHADLAVGAQR